MWSISLPQLVSTKQSQYDSFPSIKYILSTHMLKKLILPSSQKHKIIQLPQKNQCRSITSQLPHLVLTKTVEMGPAMILVSGKDSGGSFPRKGVRVICSTNCPRVGNKPCCPERTSESFLSRMFDHLPFNPSL